MKRSAVNFLGDIVIYDDSDHTYTMANSGKQLVSVTQFIKKFTPEFQSKEVAEKCAGKGKYAGLTADQILDVWEAEGNRGCEEGHHLHLYQECLLTGHPLPDPQNVRETLLFYSGERAVAALLKKFVFIGAEVILFSSELGIAGTTDLIMMDPANNALLLLDWKQNKKITQDNPWEKMKAPIGHLDSCDIVKYGIQLNLYEHLLRSMNMFPPSVNIRKGIIYITEKGFFSYPVKNIYQAEIRNMMNVFNQNN